MRSPLSIGILETGKPPKELVKRYAFYPNMVEDWLADFDADFQSYAVLDNQFPSSPLDHDLWVITGSKFGTYEDFGWISKLEDFVRDCRDARQPMFGICFGHQIIAQALGGVVRKSDKGWGLGLHDYTCDWPTDQGSKNTTLTLTAYHQDQVETLPEGAQRVATSAFCENAALFYPGFALSVQGHPEFREDFFKDLTQLRVGESLTQQDVSAAARSYDRADTAMDLLGLIRSLLLNEPKETHA